MQAHRTELWKLNEVSVDSVVQRVGNNCTKEKKKRKNVDCALFPLQFDCAPREREGVLIQSTPSVQDEAEARRAPGCSRSEMIVGGHKMSDDFELDSRQRAREGDLRR